MTTIKSGDKVRCIEGHTWNDGADRLVVGTIYTVDRCNPKGSADGGETEGVVWVAGDPGAWRLNRFEPVAESPAIVAARRAFGEEWEKVVIDYATNAAAEKDAKLRDRFQQAHGLAAAAVRGEKSWEDVLANVDALRVRVAARVTQGQYT